MTLLTSLFGGYFQYLNAYQDKVSTQAKEDMTAAAATFAEVSNSFAEMQALQYDVVSTQARELLPLFLPHLPPGPIKDRLAR